MTHYLFNTVANMKEYNHSKWWIDSNIIKSMDIFADNITAAVKEYQAKVNDSCLVNISNNAIKNKSPMYIDTTAGDTKQIGFVITASSEFETDHYSGVWVKQYIDLWVEVLTITNTDFKEV